MNFIRRHPILVPITLLAASGAMILGQRLWKLHGQVERYAQYWSVPRGDAGGLRYVALGNSAAQGIGASDPQHGYVSLIADRLRRLTGKPVEVMNISQSGARIGDVVRDQLPRLAGLRPDLVTVDVGANNIRDWHPGEFADYAAALCEGLASTQAVVGDVPYFMHGRWEKDAEAAADTLTRECEKHGIAVASLHATFESLGWWGMFNLYAADWFHLNNRGHEIWADMFWQAAPKAAFSVRSAAYR